MLPDNEIGEGGPIRGVARTEKGLYGTTEELAEKVFFVF
jgi:hypothetical protein